VLLSGSGWPALARPVVPEATEYERQARQHGEDEHGRSHQQEQLPTQLRGEFQRASCRKVAVTETRVDQLIMVSRPGDQPDNALVQEVARHRAGRNGNQCDQPRAVEEMGAHLQTACAEHQHRLAGFSLAVHEQEAEEDHHSQQ